MFSVAHQDRPTMIVPEPDRPSVLAVAEMNLEEYPAFRLGRRSKRTEIRHVRSRTLPDGHLLEQVWIVRGAEGLGLPGPFEQDLYVGLLVLFTEQGLPADGRIRFTRNRLAQQLGISNSGRGYELIEQGLARLAGATIHSEHAFLRPGPIGPDRARIGPTERLSVTFHILEEVRVHERAAGLAARRLALVDPEGGRLEPARPTESSIARLGAPLVQNYDRRYTKGLDATFYFQLGRPLSRRLFRYLDKVRNGRASYEIGLRTLADVLGLEYRFPSDIKVGLAEAHDDLVVHGYLSGAQYLPMAGGPSAGEKVCYAIDPRFDARPRRRAGTTTATAPIVDDEERSTRIPDVIRVAPPTTAVAVGAPVPISVIAPAFAAVAEPHAVASDPSPADAAAMTRVATLVSFGITRSRARHLVTTFPGQHIDAQVEAFRARLERARSGRGGIVAPRNPAGYLAQSIIEGFATRTDGAQATTRVEEPRPLPDIVPLPPVPAAPLIPPPPLPLPEGPPAFVAVCAAMRATLTSAMYGAWVATLTPVDGVAIADDVVTMRVPNLFAMGRWNREPLASALTSAEASVGVRIVLKL